MFLFSPLVDFGHSLEASQEKPGTETRQAWTASAWKDLRIVFWAEEIGSWLPSGYVNSLLVKMAIEIVDLPIKNGDFP